MTFESPREALLLLGIEGAAGREDVKAAYRDLLKVFHPDANPPEELAWQYYDIVDAYDYLMTVFDALEAGGQKATVGGRKIAAVDWSFVEKIPKGNGGPSGSQSSRHPENFEFGPASGNRPVSGPRVIGDAAGAMETRARQAQRNAAKKKAGRKKERDQDRLEQARQEAVFRDAMDRIHAARAGQLAAEIIEAMLKGKQE